MKFMFTLSNAPLVSKKTVTAKPFFAETLLNFADGHTQGPVCGHPLAKTVLAIAQGVSVPIYDPFKALEHKTGQTYGPKASRHQVIKFTGLAKEHYVRLQPFQRDVAQVVAGFEKLPQTG